MTGQEQRALIELSTSLYGRGWLEGTSGNLSVRSRDSAGLVRITASGRGKGELTENDIVDVDLGSGRPRDPSAPPPSAETAIHLALYRAHPACGAVVHAHMPYATVLAARAATQGQSSVDFADFELLKGFGIGPVGQAAVPVFANHRDVPRIGDEVFAHYRVAAPDRPPVLLIAHHGATSWGPDLHTARNRLECLEELCRLTVLFQVLETTNRPTQGER